MATKKKTGPVTELRKRAREPRSTAAHPTEADDVAGALRLSPSHLLMLAEATFRQRADASYGDELAGDILRALLTVVAGNVDDGSFDMAGRPLTTEQRDELERKGGPVRWARSFLQTETKRRPHMGTIPPRKRPDAVRDLIAIVEGTKPRSNDRWGRLVVALAGTSSLFGVPQVHPTHVRDALVKSSEETDPERVVASVLLAIGVSKDAAWNAIKGAKSTPV